MVRRRQFLAIVCGTTTGAIGTQTVSANNSRKGFSPYSLQSIQSYLIKFSGDSTWGEMTQPLNETQIEALKDYLSPWIVERTQRLMVSIHNPFQKSLDYTQSRIEIMDITIPNKWDWEVQSNAHLNSNAESLEGQESIFIEGEIGTQSSWCADGEATYSDTVAHNPDWPRGSYEYEHFISWDWEHCYNDWDGFYYKHVENGSNWFSVDTSGNMYFDQVTSDYDYYTNDQSKYNSYREVQFCADFGYTSCWQPHLTLQGRYTSAGETISSSST